MEDRFGLSALERDCSTASAACSPWPITPLRRPRLRPALPEDPEKALRLVRLLIIPAPCSYRCSTRCRTPFLFRGVQRAPAILLMTAFTMVGPILQSVTPYRLRAWATPLGAIYVFFVGTAGTLLAAFFTDALSPVAASDPGWCRRRSSAASRPAQLHVHQERPLPRGGRAPARRGRKRQLDPERTPDAPGRLGRLLLRPRAGALRRGVRGSARARCCAARHQRRREVDDPAGDRRPGHAARGVVRLEAAPSPVSRAQAAGALGIPPAARRQGVFPR